MDDYQNSLAETYSQKSDTALLDLHTQGSLRGVAYVIIEKELIKRGIDVPTRPKMRVFINAFFSAILPCIIILGICEHLFVNEFTKLSDILSFLVTEWMGFVFFAAAWAVVRTLEANFCD